MMNSTEIHTALKKLDSLSTATLEEIEGLRELGYVYKDRPALTQKGKSKLAYYNRTGDGPESLKRLFRF